MYLPTYVFTYVHELTNTNWSTYSTASDLSDVIYLEHSDWCMWLAHAAHVLVLPL